MKKREIMHKWQLYKKFGYINARMEDLTRLRNYIASRTSIILFIYTY